MNAHPLDNPIWESLASRHRALALRHGDVARYPAPVAPFLGVAKAGIDAAAALEALVAPEDSVFLLGPTPAVAEGWQLRHLAMLAQMACTQPLAEPDGPGITELGEAHRADVLALTALVYPHYFRPRTMALGRYFGIYLPDGAGDTRLAAIIGERMGTDDWQEISAVCTHPDFNGRGYARHLLAWLSNDVLARGRTPFLHVSHDNARAKQLYQQAGYHFRPDIAFWSLRRG
ncbi:GNAT family N-acetyltransferase [Lysobacter koreensis]|uniref:GNAT family N-acetyltransferase n=1 Tax=Lysobacter koreensis TaxID=266122 RepID=A0ABW2YSI4_9GAMM